jgi:hypothetical protein
MISLEDRSWLSQPGFVLAYRVDPPTNRRHMLAQVQVETLGETRVDLPTPLGQELMDGLMRAEDHTDKKNKAPFLPPRRRR